MGSHSGELADFGDDTSSGDLLDADGDFCFFSRLFWRRSPGADGKKGADKKND